VYATLIPKYNPQQKIIGWPQCSTSSLRHDAVSVQQLL